MAILESASRPSSSVNDEHQADPVIIVGGGLAGSLMAVFLAQRGFLVEVYEYRPDIRTAEVDKGRSINMALSTRGLAALEAVGLRQGIEDLCIPMHGRFVHPLNGTGNLQPYGMEGQFINSISRSLLNQFLLDAAEKYDNVSFYFQHRCTGVDLKTGNVTFENLATRQSLTRPSQLVVGADGAYSAVRQQMQKTPYFDYEQQYLNHSYKELTMPPADNGEFRLEPNALHIWPRHEYMLIALPNLDRTFTCTLFMPFSGDVSFESLRTPEDVHAFFSKEFPDAVANLPGLTDQFFTNPTSSLVTIRCNPYHYGSRAVLIGDAAHAMVPFYGQGMNAAFESCLLLDQIIDQYGDDWELVLSEFSKQRKANADAISLMAQENYLEMRSKVASSAFIFRKKLEKTLHRLFPKGWIPLYTMVTFMTLPYAEAYRRSQIQDTILRRATIGIPIIALLLIIFLIQYSV